MAGLVIHRKRGTGSITLFGLAREEIEDGIVYVTYEQSMLDTSARRDRANRAEADRLEWWYAQHGPGDHVNAGRPPELSRPDVRERIRLQFEDAMRSIASDMNQAMAEGRLSPVQLAEGEIANQMGCAPRTIRRYIKEGIIPPPAEWPLRAAALVN